MGPCFHLKSWRGIANLLEIGYSYLDIENIGLEHQNYFLSRISAVDFPMKILKYSFLTMTFFVVRKATFVSSKVASGFLSALLYCAPKGSWLTMCL